MAGNDRCRNAPSRWKCCLVLLAVTPGLAAVWATWPVSQRPPVQAPASPAGVVRAQGLGRVLLGASGAVEPARAPVSGGEGAGRER